MVRDWQEVVKGKKAEQSKQLPQEWLLPESILSTISDKSDISVLNVPAECGLLTAKELDITSNYDAVDLVEKMANKELSSVEVTTAFCKRAAVAQQVVCGSHESCCIS
jgi:amidase